MQISKENETEISKELSERINSAKNVDDLLNVSNDPKFDKQLASSVVHNLYNWITAEKVNIDNIVNDKRYIKICNTLEISVNPPNHLSNTKVLKTIGINEKPNSESSLYDLLQTVTNKDEIEKLSIPQMIKVRKIFLLLINT